MKVKLHRGAMEKLTRGCPWWFLSQVALLGLNGHMPLAGRSVTQLISLIEKSSLFRSQILAKFLFDYMLKRITRTPGKYAKRSSAPFSLCHSPAFDTFASGFWS